MSSTTTYIDPLQTASRHYRLILENDRVRVLEMLLPAGEKDKKHSHPCETVHFVHGGKARIYLPGDESVELDIPDGHVMWHEQWTHQVENIGTTDIRAIIVEDKTSL